MDTPNPIYNFTINNITRHTIWSPTIHSISDGKTEGHYDRVKEFFSKKLDEKNATTWVIHFYLLFYSVKLLQYHNVLFKLACDSVSFYSNDINPNTRKFTVQ